MREASSGPVDRLRASLEEAGIDLWRRRPFVAATMAAIGVTLAFPALAVVLLGWSAQRLDELRAGNRLRVYLRAEAGPAAVEDVRAALLADPAVTSLDLVTAEQARARFARRFPELADLPVQRGADELSLPASFEAGVPGGGEDAARVAARVRGLPAVEDVRHDAAWSEALARLGRSVRAARAGIVALALAITGFGIANVVRIDALSRREELAIMRLVGAPALHLRLPFVLVGAVQGALGGAVATALVALLARALVTPLALVLPAAAAGLPHGTTALLVGGAALAGAAGAALSVEGVLRRHARLER